jgi:hypothetical protein
MATLEADAALVKQVCDKKREHYDTTGSVVMDGRLILVKVALTIG